MKTFLKFVIVFVLVAGGFSTIIALDPKNLNVESLGRVAVFASEAGLSFDGVVEATHVGHGKYELAVFVVGDDNSQSLLYSVQLPSRLKFLIAEVCLLGGSVRNAYHTKYRTYLSQHPPTCETLRIGILGAGAAFIVFTGIVSELYYVSYSKSDERYLPHSMGSL